MPAHIDTLALSAALQAVGLPATRSDGIARAMQDVAMKDTASQSDLDKILHVVTVRVGLMIGGSTLALIVAIVASLISLSK